MYILFSYPAVKNASNEAEPDFHSQGIGLYKYLYSHPLKDALLINNQDINVRFTMRCLQVFVPLRLKTCRLYDKQDLSPALIVQFVGRPTDPPQHPLYQLADKIDWQRFETSFSPLYCADNGRPAKPISLMCGLLILKHVRNLSDESVVEQWSENAYFQYFCGMFEFTPSFPCNASELVHFRSVSARRAWN